jgi:hypothetical protein
VQGLIAKFKVNGKILARYAQVTASLATSDTGVTPHCLQGVTCLHRVHVATPTHACLHVCILLPLGRTRFYTVPERRTHIRSTARAAPSPLRSTQYRGPYLLVCFMCASYDRAPWHLWHEWSMRPWHTAIVRSKHNKRPEVKVRIRGVEIYLKVAVVTTLFGMLWMHSTLVLLSSS